MLKAERPGMTEGHIEELCLVLSDDPGIRNINRRHLNSDRPTDVISFLYLPVPGTKECRADVIVNVQRASDCRIMTARWTRSMELALYIAHGCDHLTGADDRTRNERNRMRQRELRWLRDPAVRKTAARLFPA